MSSLLAQRVRVAVKRTGVGEFLRKSGVSRSTLYEILRGESAGRGGTLEKLARAGVNLNGVFAQRPRGKAA